MVVMQVHDTLMMIFVQKDDGGGTGHLIIVEVDHVRAPHPEVLEGLLEGIRRCPKGVDLHHHHRHIHHHLHQTHPPDTAQVAVEA